VFPSDDTIAAISTAAGSAARAIVRASGPDAVAIAGRLFTPAGGSLASLGGFRAADGRVHVPALELPARAYVFRAPRSYTRQDVVELHVPGSAVVASAVLEAFFAAGARAARSGEFTARAFFSGRLDLSAAEAVADVIDAANDAQLRAAMAALGGRVSRLVRGAAEDIAEVLASVEASIDLAEEEIALAAPADLAAELHATARRLRAQADNARAMSDSAELPRIVLCGRPNVGKSSLLNALSGQDRAIVSAAAGTTRDVLSATLDLDGAPVLLQDAAGLWSGAGRHDPQAKGTGRPDTGSVAPTGGMASSLAAAADSASRHAVARADVVCFVYNAPDGLTPDDEILLAELRSHNPRAPHILVANKSDLLRGGRQLAPRPHRQPNGQPTADNRQSAPRAIAASALTAAGLEELKGAMGDLLHLHASRSGEALGLHDRQRRCILAAAEAAVRAAGLLAAAPTVADVAELAAVELRDALAQLALVSPDCPHIVADDVLGRVFSRFCVGK
jgi:tRNA modification GTPase